MLRKFKTPAILFLLLSLVGLCQSQSLTNDINNEFVIDNLSVKEGLASNFVTKTVSDSSNLKYFATEGGLSRYDGYTFKTYRPGINYPGLRNENIETLFKDKDNNIWIGTKSGGISMLETNKNRIVDFNGIFKIKSETQLHVMSLMQDARGYIWMGTWSNGVFVFDPQDKKVISHYSYQTPILRIIKDRENNIWFAANKQLMKVSSQKYQLQRINTPYSMSTIVEDKFRNKIWAVGNQENTVHLVNVDTKSLEVVVTPTDFEAKFVRSMAIDSKNRLWLGSWGNGLFISDAKVDKFYHVNTDPNESKINNVNNSRILDIEIDDNGVAWLGTGHGGVLMLYPNKGFQFIQNNAGKNIIDNNVISVYSDKDLRLYVGTVNEGLSATNGSNQFSSVTRIPNTRVNVIEEIGRNLFVGTTKGLIIIKDRNFAQPIVTLANEKITAILLDEQKNIWVGTQEAGLKVTNFVEDPSLEKMTLYSEGSHGQYYLENNRINKIIQDLSGQIWIATYSGLNRYNTMTKGFMTQTQLCHEKIPSIIINDFIIKDKMIYAATPGGLVVFSQNKGSLNLEAIYDQKNGLKNDFICALEADNEGNIWLSSITSIIRFDPILKVFTSFNTKSGIKVNSFHNGSSYKDMYGSLYFGGDNGLIKFDPTQLVEQTYQLKVIFTDVIVNNTVLNVGDEVNGRVILNSDINFVDKLNLGYNQNHLTLGFTTNDFLSQDQVFYQYRMKGFQDDWLDLGGRNEVSFTGLNSGKYDFQLRASKDRQNWSAMRNLGISVSNPPWSTWYAYTFYMSLLLAAGYLIKYISTRKANLEAKVLIAQIAQEKEHDLNESKIAFFTNISHEFRTPLTLVLSPVTEMLADNSLKKDVKVKLNLIESNANRLLNLINQLLDFRKSEFGLLQLNYQEVDFIAFAHQVFNLFSNVAKSKSINYRFISELDTATIAYDKDKMEIVLCNILSNAFKFTKSNGEVTMHIYKENDYLNINIQDNGIGLSHEDAEKVFDRFYQANNGQNSTVVGSGIGLAFTKTILDLHHGNIFVNSSIDVGTNFTCQLLFDNPFVSNQKIQINDTASQVAPITSDDSQSILWREEAQTDLKELQRMSILIVDDNDDIRKYVKSMFEENFKIFEAENGLIGLRIAKAELPDIIISDVMMPEMDGIEFCKEIKGKIDTSHIPIILLTASSSASNELIGLETGADDYITKPFNPVLMKTRVNNILENRKKQRLFFQNKVRFEPDTNLIDEPLDLDQAFVEKAMKLVNDNLSNEEFNLDALLQEFFMSRSTLYRKIKSLTGLSITGFVRSVRLKKAAQLILSQNIKMSQVAYEVGFNDYKYFKSSFQQQFGCLPSEYRIKEKEKKQQLSLELEEKKKGTEI